MDKLDYKKDFKELYLPPKKPVIVAVPPIKFIMVAGSGDPNGEEFALRTAALYSLSYAVKMSYKGSHVPVGYYDYTVFPLEGVWDLVDKTLPLTDKSNFSYNLMIRQPEFLTAELFAQFREETAKKKPNPYLDSMEFGTLTEGLCCQMLHIGSYDCEPESFAVMNQYCREHNYRRRSLQHRELYLSDPRKTETHKLKTVLRYQVENA